MQDVIWPLLEAKPLQALRALVVCTLIGSILATALAFHFGASVAPLPALLSPSLTRLCCAVHQSEVTHFERRFVAASGQTFVALQRTLNQKVVSAQLCAKHLAVLSYVDRANTTDYVTGRVQDEGEDVLRVSLGNRLAWEFLVEDARRAEFERIAAEAADVGAIERPLLDRIWQLNQSGQRVASPPALLYSVMWAQTALDRGSLVLFNSNSVPARARAARAALATNQTTVSGVIRTGLLDPADVLKPVSVVYSPSWIYDQFHPTSTPSTINQRAAAVSRGSVCSYSFRWLTAIEDSLASHFDSALLVLQCLDDGDGEIYTFSVTRGRVDTIAEGDAHRTLTPRKLQKYKRVQTLSVAGTSHWRVTLYPRRDQYGLSVGSTSMRDALIVSGLLFLSLLIIVAYEFVVRKRDMRVSGMFNKQIKDLGEMRRSVDLAHEREAQAEALVLAGSTEVSEHQHFVATVSHEIRTPLNSVTGAAALLAQGANLTREQLELIDLLQAGAAQVILIVEDVLQLSALTSGQFPLASEPVLLTTSSGLLEQAVLMIRLAASRRTKAVAITLDVKPGTPEVILTDPGRLLQVLTNLLGNARKFVPADGGAIQLCVDIIDRAPLPSTTDDAASDAPAPPSRWLRCMVLDNGIGIDPAHLERIFQPFTQEDSTTRREFGGAGLGLSICRRIVTAMGGTITAYSKGRNQGAVFTFTIPLRLPTPEQLEQLRSHAPTAAAFDIPVAGGWEAERQEPPWSPRPTDVEAPPLPRSEERKLLRVLVAEDDLSSQRIIKMLLTKMGCAVTCVNNGAAAVAAYQTETFDLVITDLHMPVLDGLATSGAICALGRRGDRPLTPVVALSASCSPEVIQRCREAGMERHISKPVNAERLRLILDIVRKPPDDAERRTSRDTTDEKPQ